MPRINDYAGHKILWAPAALIMGDEASFYRCGFASVQDTLSDFQGRHYYESCYIEGAVDFIWGNGQSYFTVRSSFLIFGNKCSHVFRYLFGHPNIILQKSIY